jgi:hypothetical protein
VRATRTPPCSWRGGLPNFFMINGKAYPATDTIHMRVGERVLFRFIGSSKLHPHDAHPRRPIHDRRDRREPPPLRTHA